MSWKAVIGKVHLRHVMVSDMIKVNQISTVAQAARFQKWINICGICIAKDEIIRPPYINIEMAVALRKQFPDLAISVSFSSHNSFSTAEITDLLELIRPNFFEFTPIDFAKTDLFEAQILEYSGLSLPKIANGFFIQRDDCGFIKDIEPFHRMRDIDVELFQFEINSAVDKDFLLRASDLKEAENFFRLFPSIISDSVKQIKSYPIKHIAGYFFNISPTKDIPNYDYSLLRRTESEITRILLSS